MNTFAVNTLRDKFGSLIKARNESSAAIEQAFGIEEYIDR